MSDPPEKGRVAALDGLRGIAAVAVVMHHGINICDLTLPTRVVLPKLADVPPADWPGRLALSVFNGGAAVNIFFVLSGAVLFASLLREPAIDVRTAALFVARRILRIYPALIVAVLAFGAVSYVTIPYLFSVPFTPAQMLTNSLLLDFGVNGATWTLQVEVLMVPIILAVAWFHRLFGPLALTGFLLFALYRLYGSALFGMATMAVAVPAFAFGMLVPTVEARRAISRFPAWSWAPCLVLIVAIRFFAPVDGAHDVIATLALSFVAVAAIYHLAPTKGALCRPVPRFLGRISYSLYLWHAGVMYELFPAFQWLFGAERVHMHYLLFGLLYGLLVVVVAIPFAALTERWVEQPFIALGRELPAILQVMGNHQRSADTAGADECRADLV